MTVDRSVMGRRSKARGKGWERAIARAFRAIFGEGIFRGHQDSRGGAAASEGADVDGSFFWVEAKHGKAVSVWAALRQARTKQAEVGDVRPRLVIAKTRKRPPPGHGRREPEIAVMELEDFLELLADYYRLRCRYDAEVEPTSPIRPSGEPWREHLK